MSNMKSSLSLGQRIRLAREKSGLSQSELGQILQLSDKAISSYEVSRAEPSIETLKKISRATSTPVTYFVTDNVSSSDLVAAKLDQIEQELAKIRKLIEAEQ